VAKLSPQLLGESKSLVAEFLLGQLAEDGGFCGRDSDDGDVDNEGVGDVDSDVNSDVNSEGNQRGGAEGDLYYTIFGLDALNALDETPPADRVMPFLGQFGDGADLDLIYLSCLIRSWTALGALQKGPDAAILLDHLGKFRHPDGGWSVDLGGPRGSTYGAFLAIASYQDLEAEIPDTDAAVRFLADRQMEDGGFAPDAHLAVSTTPTTAAGVSALRQLEAEAKPGAIDWLRAQYHPQGGFLPAPGAPMPDLLSTAVALHALSTLGASLADLVEPTLDYIDTLWTARGGFHGHWADDVLDCEYTFYGLLALGHLSVWNR
jgi:hypothetical protein